MPSDPDAGEGLRRPSPDPIPSALRRLAPRSGSSALPSSLSVCSWHFSDILGSELSDRKAVWDKLSPRFQQSGSLGHQLEYVFQDIILIVTYIKYVPERYAMLWDVDSRTGLWNWHLGLAHDTDSILLGPTVWQVRCEYVVCVCEGGYELWLTSAAENYSMMEIVHMKISDSSLLICYIM